MPRQLPTKTCSVCGRTMTWRMARAENWDEVRHRSQRCRRRRDDPVAAELETALRQLPTACTATGGICPSEVAHTVEPDDWGRRLEPARAAACPLLATGEMEITQAGRVVDASSAKGPIRIRRARRP